MSAIEHLRLSIHLLSTSSGSCPSTGSGSGSSYNTNYTTIIHVAFP